MKTLVKTKLLVDDDRRYLELRDYELGKGKVRVINCVDKDYKTCAHFGEMYMHLTPSQQKKGKVVNTQQSIYYPYSYYKMLKFLWKPSGRMPDQMVSMDLSVRQKLSEKFKEKYGGR